MKKLGIFLLWIVGAFLICNLIFYAYEVDISKIADHEFLFSFVGILLGFSLTIFTFIVSMVEKVKDKADLKFQNQPSRKEKLQGIIDGLYREIKDDVYFNFISLILIALIYIVESHNFNLNYNLLFFEKALVFKSLKFAIFCLNIYSIYDLMGASFKLSDTVGILKQAEEE